MHDGCKIPPNQNVLLLTINEPKKFLVKLILSFRPHRSEHVQIPAQHTTLTADTSVTEIQGNIQNPQHTNCSLLQ